MPKESTLAWATFYNLGPLRTTFTAPPVCSTSTNHIAVLTESTAFALPISCPGLDDPNCYPSGTNLLSAESTGLLENPYYWWAYYSPGLVCPSGWATFGIAAPILTDTAISLSGVFTSISSYSDPFFSALKPQETVVACCPRYAYSQRPPDE